VELIGLYLVACYLLVAAGAAKAVRPDGTARALAGLPANRLSMSWMRRFVRAIAVAELACGLVALAVPHPAVAWLVAVSYAAFAVVVVYVRKSGGALASCGCFGTPDTPATTLHLVVVVVLCAAAAAIALAHPAGSMLGILARQPGEGAPLAAASALAAWLAYLAMVALADLQAARALNPVSFGRDR
jgi:Methylamine utilisation protein MauE